MTIRFSDPGSEQPKPRRGAAKKVRSGRSVLASCLDPSCVPRPSPVQMMGPVLGHPQSARAALQARIPLAALLRHN